MNSAHHNQGWTKWYLTISSKSRIHYLHLAISATQPPWNRMASAWIVWDLDTLWSSKSLHCCRRCQKPHHTLLHIETKDSTPTTLPDNSTIKPIISTATAGLTSNSRLVTWSYLCWHSRWFLPKSSSHSWFCLLNLLCVRTFNSEPVSSLFTSECQNLRCHWSIS